MFTVKSRLIPATVIRTEVFNYIECECNRWHCHRVSIGYCSEQFEKHNLVQGCFHIMRIGSLDANELGRAGVIIPSVLERVAMLCRHGIHAIGSAVHNGCARIIPAWQDLIGRKCCNAVSGIIYVTHRFGFHHFP